MIQPFHGTLPQPGTSARLRLAADRLHRAAHVADAAGWFLIASSLLGAMDLIRAADRDAAPLSTIATAERLAAVILGDHDQEPLP